MIYNESSVKDRNLVLDGLRGLAVLMVLWSHATDLGIPKTSLLNLEGGGRYGVYLFFVLSSFLLSHQIITCSPGHLRQASYWINYAIRRFFRIFPVFAVALVAYVLLANGIPAKFPKTWLVAWEVMTLQREWAVFWTISVEVKYYFLLPIFALVFRSLIPYPQLGLLVFLGLAGSISILAPPETGIKVWSYIPIFLCGSYAALLAVQIYQSDAAQTSAVALQWIVHKLGYISIIFVIALLPAVGRQFDPAMRLDLYHLWYFPFGLAFGALVLSAYGGSGWLRTLFSSRVLVLMGRISFSMYLLHMLIMGHVIEQISDLWLRIVAYALGTLIAGTIGFLVIERPFSRLRLALNK